MTLAIGAGCASNGDSLGTGGTGDGGATLSGLQAQLTAAAAVWETARFKCVDYLYENDHSYGTCSKTTIEIVDDEPVSRSYVSCALVSDGGTIEQWSEVGISQIDTHLDGAYPWPVEGMLGECQAILNDALAAPSAYSVSMTFSAQGVPGICLGTELQCDAKDCTFGLDISSFACRAPAGADAGHD